MKPLSTVAFIGAERSAPQAEGIDPCKTPWPGSSPGLSGCPPKRAQLQGLKAPIAHLATGRTKLAFQEDPKIVNEDWRLNAITTTTSPVRMQHYHPAGTVVKNVVQIHVAQRSPIYVFGQPNVAALMLDESHRIWSTTGSFVNAFKSTPDGSLEPLEGDTEVFNIIQARMASVVFAFTAVEAFANQQIALAYLNESYQFVSKRKSGVHEVWSLERIERKMQIEEKLCSVLTDLLKVKSPKGRSAWNGFQRLKVLRDHIVHCKVRDLVQSAPSQDTLWRRLSDLKFVDPSAEAFGIIDFYSRSMQQPLRWAAKYPHEAAAARQKKARNKSLRGAR